MKVLTKDGLVDRGELTVKDVVEEHDNARVTATEWYRGDELMRRDVNVNILRGHEMGSEQGQVG